MNDFSQEDKNRLIEGKPYGFVINRGGPCGLDTRAPFYGLKSDVENPNCRFALVECFGCGTWVRYYKWDIVLN